MAIDRETAIALRARIEDVHRWLGEEAPYAAVDQRHLEEHTPERAYWHYGYMTALRDVLSLLDRPSQTHGSEGKSS